MLERPIFAIKYTRIPYNVNSFSGRDFGVILCENACKCRKWKRAKEADSLEPKGMQEVMILQLVMHGQNSADVESKPGLSGDTYGRIIPVFPY